MRKLLDSPWQTLSIPSALTLIGQFHHPPPSPVPGDLGRDPSHQSPVLEHRDTYGFFWRFSWLLNSLQKKVFSYTKIHSLVVNGVVTASSHAGRRNKFARGKSLDSRNCSSDFLSSEFCSTVCIPLGYGVDS